MHRFLVFLFVLTGGPAFVSAQNDRSGDWYDIVYTSASDSYSLQQCKLDVHIPADTTNFTTIVWFHEGGLTSGRKDIPPALKGKGVAIVSAGYRFSPEASVDEIIRDAAQAVKWAYDHVEEYGGRKDRIVIGGYSAGAYLALMLAMNKRYLGQHSIDVDGLMGVVAVSGHTITHFEARRVMGREGTEPLIDTLAPLYWVRKDAMPMLLITGDRELEMLGRYEENAYFKRMLQLAGHPEVTLYELEGYDHGVAAPAIPLVLKQVARWSQETN